MFQQSLRTERLVFRPFERRDIARIAELMNNWDVARMLAMPPYPYTKADARSFVDSQLALAPVAEHFTSAIAIGDELVGTIGVGPRHHGPSIGYWLGEPYWGQGYMTEALAAATRLFFASSKWDWLGSGYFLDNPASFAVQRKIGFTVVGESIQSCVARGEKVRHFDTRLTRVDFEARVA